jgi:galactokinase
VPPSFVARAPGRVNLIGEHTDYNEGFVLPMSIDRSVSIAFAPRTDSRVVVRSADFAGVADFAVEELRTPPESGSADWTEYVRGVAWAFGDAGLRLRRGIDAVAAGDVPVGAGLSSSAALELAVARALAQANDLPWDAARMARVCQRAENEWVGVQCGIMDQLISAAAVQGHCLLIDCRSLDTRRVPIPPGAAVVILDTGTRRALADSEYNERRMQCREAAALFGKTVLRDVYMGMLEARARELAPVVHRRARHVVLENARTIAASAALERGDLATVGALMDESHVSLRDDFEVSSPALDCIVSIARAQKGCFGARMTGAGFGGCAVALTRADLAPEFARVVKESYDRETGHVSAAYISLPASGASISSGDETAA